MNSDRQGLLVKLLVLVLAVKITTQGVKYYVQVDSVQKTLIAQLFVYHQRGADAYASAVTRELRQLGLVVDQERFTIVEDRRNDELRVELTYTWPLDVLWWRFERVNIAAARSTILDA